MATTVQIETIDRRIPYANALYQYYKDHGYDDEEAAWQASADAGLLPDPMQPDWEALANKRVVSQYIDSAESAGLR